MVISHGDDITVITTRAGIQVYQLILEQSMNGDTLGGLMMIDDQGETSQAIIQSVQKQNLNPNIKYAETALNRCIKGSYKDGMLLRVTL